jgi:hypothetical protein
MKMAKFPDWNEEFTDYLLANGLNRKNSVEKENGAMYFSNLRNAVMVYPSGKIAFYEWTDGTNDKREEWRKGFEFTGYGLLNLHEFKLLCHITGLAQFKESIEKALTVKKIRSNKDRLIKSDNYKHKRYLDFNLIQKRLTRKQILSKKLSLFK